jgi:hypothetical protein
MKRAIDFKALRNTSETTRIFIATGEWPSEMIARSGELFSMPSAIIEIDHILSHLIERIEALEVVQCRDVKGGAV